MTKDHPRFIQTEQGFVFQIVGSEGERLMIDQGKFVVFYDILEEAFYGVDNGVYVKRYLTPKFPALFKPPDK